MKPLTLAEWNEMQGTLAEPFDIEDFKCYYGISDIEFKFAMETTAKLTENGGTEITIIGDDGDGIVIQINNNQITYINAI
ncbi:MAG: hypothetical protein PHZ11_00790 [Desulfitobacteriaceae bacterium]|nr:hypothetical protein [Desulfitobacteriaceae bacterium]MDD4345430.1 hypothetical protein [Desulfitobacteriaceae bacterium]MDD4400723.1 hypothetical protein [Desulfitobacteriaceae bacterium]